MPGFFDTAKPGQPLTNSVPPVLPSANWTTSALRTSGFSLLNSPARTRPCERFTRRLTTTGASLGVEVIGYSFLPAGLSPAVLPKLACRSQLAWRSQSSCRWPPGTPSSMKLGFRSPNTPVPTPLMPARSSSLRSTCLGQSSRSCYRGNPAMRTLGGPSFGGALSIGHRRMRGVPSARGCRDWFANLLSFLFFR